MKEDNQSAEAMGSPTISKSVVLMTDGRSEQVAYLALFTPDLPEHSVHALELASADLMRKVMSAISESLFRLGRGRLYDAFGFRVHVSGIHPET